MTDTSDSTGGTLRRQETANQKKAQRILQGESATPESMLDLSKELKDEKKFGYARKLLALARTLPVEDEKNRTKLRQQHALCTYKDPDLPADERLERAFEILQEDEDLGVTRDQETLGLAGAIFKRRWEVDAQKENLERSLSYYLRGYRIGPKTDQGYTGINAAFVLDLLASLESREARRAATDSRVADTRKEQAREIREDLVDQLPPLLEDPDSAWLTDRWWFYATLAEAHFGLGRYDVGRYDEALTWLKKGVREAKVPDWEYQSTATQLGTLARAQAEEDASAADFAKSPAGQALEKFLGDKAAGVFTAYIGKVGLALSGGGFRASLFHIGVLARLAELDMLRHVEVLSCVSGGSILGAHYYLELRKLFKGKTDDEITRQDYIDLVKRLERDFLDGVQENIRTRVAAELITNLKMIFLPNYSRTMRAGELYERWLYRKVEDGEGSRPRWVTDLYIEPKGEEPKKFRPRNDNWRRRAKVPDLILNATTLNTGHNWQFTASWMGEPPGSIATEVDGNYRLRRMYYWEAPDSYQRIRLGYAVGASACVPGLFEPLSLKKLYPGITVRLVDGGVHDNQGIVGLQEQDCSVMLISDASGQMGTQDEPSIGVLGVPLRSQSIMMSRIREEQFDDLEGRRRSGLLRGLMFVHLKQDLDVDPVDWQDCPHPHEASDEARPRSRRGLLTRYGIRKDSQRQVAAIRTDLDSFCDAEAFALMTSGFRMTAQAFADDPALQSLPLYEEARDADGAREDWRFLRVEKAMQDKSQAARLDKLLSVTHHKAFKIWRLMMPLKVLAWALAVAAVAGLAWLFWTFRAEPLVTVGTIGGAVGAAILGTFVGKTIMKIVQFRSTLMKIGTGVALSILGPIVVRLHLKVFDWLYLRWGKADRFG